MTISLSKEEQEHFHVTLEESNIVGKHNWPNFTFDVIHENYVLYYISSKDLGNVIKEMWRVLKPGGYFITSEEQASSRVLQLLKELKLPHKYLKNGIIEKTKAYEYVIEYEKPNLYAFFASFFGHAA